MSGASQSENGSHPMTKPLAEGAGVVGLSDADIIFAQRMLPHFIAGKTAEDAARAVIDDDARLFTAFYDRRQSYYMPTADERGLSYRTGIGTGDVISTEITLRVHEALRANSSPISREG